MAEQDPQQFTAPTEAVTPTPYGWETVDAGLTLPTETGWWSIPQEAVLVADNAKNKRLREERTQAMLGVIEAVIPLPTDDMLHATAQRTQEWLVSKFTDGMTAQEKYYAFLNLGKKNEQRHRVGLANTLADKGIPIDSASTWIAAAYEGVRAITSSGEVISTYEIGNVINIADTLEELATANEVLRAWGSRFVEGNSAPTAIAASREATRLIYDLSGKGRSDTPKKFTSEEILALNSVFMDLSEAKYAGPTGENSPMLYDATERFKDGAISWRDTHNAKVGIDVLKQTLPLYETEDPKVVTRYVESISEYARNHVINDKSLVGWTKNLLPAMLRRDPQVETLVRGGNITGMRRGDFGILDYIVHAYGSEVTPAHINALVMISRGLPASDFARLEQNRKDALLLAGDFGILLDLIHDQRPGVNDVVAAMRDYYVTKDPSELEVAMDRTDYLKTDKRSREWVLNLESYDKDSGNGDETLIDVVCRVEGNTRSIDVQVPDTKDEIMHEILQRVDAGEPEALGEAFAHLNHSLLEKVQAGEIGIEPDDIKVISWMEHQGFKKLQGLEYEEQVGVANEEWFKQVLLFQELTASTGFNAVDFEKFMHSVENAQHAHDSLKLVAQHAQERAKELADAYIANGWGEKTGAIWSGNIMHELAGLGDLRRAKSAALGRHLAEIARPMRERYRGD